jgi:uncharacterized integral membrane protein (TIGR00698 family)
MRFVVARLRLEHVSAGHVLMPLCALLALLPVTPAAAALLAGALVALLAGNPFQALTRRSSHGLLSLSVVGLGAGMDLRAVARAGVHGLGYTTISMGLCLAFGLWLARRLRLSRSTGLLLTVGTAICGGSAIAAVAPVARAEDHDVSVSLATVFLLNAAALFIFPPLGHALGLSQDAFGLWSALAIHDTSSVVGAGLAYGPRALEVATTVKLARALWIVPVSLGVSVLVARARPDDARHGEGARRPWFILGFLVAAAVATFVPGMRVPGQVVAQVARQGLVLTLFLIGAGLSREALRKVGLRPLLHGITLWLVVAALSLLAIQARVIR